MGHTDQCNEHNTDDVALLLGGLVVRNGGKICGEKWREDLW